MSPQSDRRRHPRLDLELLAKAQLNGKYYQARTINVSGGGVLVEIATTRHIKPGQSLQVGIAYGKSPILSADRLEPATVVRVDQRTKRSSIVALAYDAPTMESLPAWTASRAAA